MPGGDRTEPWGLGPRTGRAVGYCAGSNVPGYSNPGFGWRGVYPSREKDTTNTRMIYE
jgi:hypothetical protein